MPRIELDKAYAPAHVESRLYARWEELGCFRAPIRKGHKPYVIMMPPPNVTGMLTLGHVLNNSLQDLLARWRRMHGDDVLWLPGTDHAGIATQIKVEDQLATEGLTRHDLGREKLVERIWEWRENYGGIILQQLRKIGASCDWSRTRFTLDPDLSRAVAEIFVRLYNKGLIYRGKRIVNWDPEKQTALSDEQVDYRNVQSNLWHFKYPLSDGSGHLVVATTRPETMLGDTAIAVHPEDERYKHLHGKTVTLPLVGRKIPIVPDDYVDREFGTGCVKVTPAHDPNDFEIGNRHSLEFLVVIGPDGTMNDNVPAEFQAFDRKEARKRVVAALEEQGFLEKVEPYSHSVGHNERTGTVIEPLLSEQWFVRMKELAEPALAAVREGRVKFHPQHWEKTYFHWLENVRDWCISRQIWWGHRIPLWTVKETGEVICSVEDPTHDPKYAGLTLVQDPDVVDTWFSSWLWPFSTLGWPEKTEDLEHFFPTSTLVTAPDIIFLWVARMIIASEEVFGVEPYRDVYFTGVVRDLQGRKMSKSLGNSPDPLEVIGTYGADALRFTIISQTPRGGDVRFGSDMCEHGRNFANKLWNATRFLLMNVPEEGETFAFDPIESLPSAPEDLIDRWITSAFLSCANDVDRALAEFRFADAAKRAYAFVWNDFCDWYLELIKVRLQGTEEERLEALRRAFGVLHGIVRLLHPFMPFVTEEIYQTLSKLSAASWPVYSRHASIMQASFPGYIEALVDSSVEAQFSKLQDVVSAIRNIRGELRIAPSLRIAAGLRSDHRHIAEEWDLFSDFVMRLAGLSEFSIDKARPKGSASAIVQGLEVFVPLHGLIDVHAERARLGKEDERLLKLVEGTRAKLANANFVERAKPEVVEAEREKLSELEHAHEKIRRFLDELEAAE
ncbi:MAG: valine--tRNA ligase [Calditrichaeota bacterium]|nr:valine--tRNA ligase [Calditrichota bacterium]MCB9391619.1 valine--tRNA ligase [Calditrichota bacterium]